MPRKSKQKESRHLAEIIPMLKEWWGEEFAKTPGSGALRWGNGFWTFADICPPESCPFVIEAKFHAETDQDELLRKTLNNGKLTWYWYFQTIPDSIRASEEMGRTLYPLMIYKVNRRANRIVLQHDLFQGLEGNETVPYVYFRHPEATPFVIVDLALFFQTFTRQVFEKRLGL